MHPYAVQSDEGHPPIHVWLLVTAVLSIGLSMVFRYVHQYVSHLTGFEDPWFWVAETPSALAIFLAMYWSFDRYLWKWQFLHRIGVVRVPNLNGDWHVEIQPSGVATDHQASKIRNGRLVIQQTLSRIMVQITTSDTESESLNASILRRGELIELRNQYRAWGISPDSEFSGCEGTNRIVFVQRSPIRPKDGHYYTDWNQQTFGRFIFQELQK